MERFFCILLSFMIALFSISCNEDDKPSQKEMVLSKVYQNGSLEMELTYGGGWLDTLFSKSRNNLKLLSLSFSRAGYVVQYEYDEQGVLKTETRYNVDGEAVLTQYSKNTQGKLASADVVIKGKKILQNSFDYNPSGMVSKVTATDPETGIGQSYQSYSYYPNGNLERYEEYGYDPDGNAVLTKEVRYSYSPAGPDPTPIPYPNIAIQAGYLFNLDIYDILAYMVADEIHRSSHELLRHELTHVAQYKTVIMDRIYDSRDLLVQLKLTTTDLLSEGGESEDSVFEYNHDDEVEMDVHVGK